ncbi:hypothetical protein P3L10_021005 [Capsicum annuum]
MLESTKPISGYRKVNGSNTSKPISTPRVFGSNIARRATTIRLVALYHVDLDFPVY